MNIEKQREIKRRVMQSPLSSCCSALAKAERW